MQAKQTVKEYINRAVAHEKLQAAVVKARKTLEKIAALESLQKEKRLSEANDLVLRLYNELFDFEDVLESIGEEVLLSLQVNECCLPSAGKFRNLNTVFGQIHKLRTDYAAYLAKDYSGSSYPIHLETKKSFEELLPRFEKKLEEIRHVQEEVTTALDSSFGDPSQLKVCDFQANIYISPPVAEGDEFKFLTERVSQKTRKNHHLFDFNSLQYAAHMGYVTGVEVFCKKLAKEGPKSLRLTGEYGVLSLSRASKCEDRVIPSLVKYFPGEVTNLLLDAIRSEDYVSVRIILNSVGTDVDLNVPALLSELLPSSRGRFDAQKMIELAKKVSSDVDLKKSREKVFDQIEQIRQFTDDHDGLNILMVIELLKCSARRSQLTQLVEENRSLLHLFCLKGHDLPIVVETFTQLMQKDQNLANAVDSLGNLPLHYAVQNNLAKSVSALLLNTANINTKNKEGKTALHIAAEIGNPEIINKLFFKGADPFVKDTNGKTPLDIIMEKQAALRQENYNKKDKVRDELEQLKTIKDTGDKDKAKGLLAVLKEALLEYNKLISSERSNHENARIQELSIRINQLKQSIKDVLTPKKNEIINLADLVGLSNLQVDRMGLQKQLDKEQTNLENSIKLLQNYTQHYSEKDNVPPAPATKREIKYTVFKGGGPKGTAHVGALIKSIEDNFVVPEKQIGTAGTSAGGIFALLWALKNTKEQLKDKLFNLDFMSFLDDSDRTHTENVMAYGDEIKAIFNGTASTLSKLMTLKNLPYLFDELGKHRSGFFKGEVYKNWIIDQILEKVRGTEVLERINVELTPDQIKEYEAIKDDVARQEYMARKKVGLLTFQDFKDFPDLFLEFKCFGTNIATQRGEEYSVEKTPNATILSALRITMSLPVVFQPAFLEERRFVREVDGKKFYQTARVDDNPRIDGGLFDNFPVSAFDVDPKTGVELYNPHTLGFCLVPPHQFQEFACDGPTHHAAVDDKSFLDYLFKMVFAVMWGQQDYYHDRGLDHERTVYVSTLDVGTLDFNISDRKKEDLCDSGGAVGVLDYEGAHGHTLEPTSLSDRVRKRLIKNGVFKEFTHHQHVHSRFEPGHLINPIEILKLYAKADEKDLPTLLKLVNPNTRDANGITALHLAQALGLRNTYDRLVKFQANENAETRNGVVASKATWEEIKSYVNPGLLPAYLFNDAGIPKYTEKDFVDSKKAKLRNEVHLKENALTQLEINRREEQEILLAKKNTEIQALTAEHRQAMEQLRKDAAQERDGNEQEKNRIIKEKEAAIEALRVQNETALREQAEQARQAKETIERDKNGLIAQKDAELAQLRSQLQQAVQESNEKNNQLDPKKMTVSLFNRYINTKIVVALQTAADYEQDSGIQTSLNQLKAEIQALLNNHPNLDGKQRIDAIKTELVDLLNDVINGEDDRYVPLTNQAWYMTFLKGFIGLIGSFTIIPLFFEGYRNTFFNGGYANQLSYLRDDVEYFEQQIVPTLAA